ncbi:hypothetical protein [Streptomyces sp. NPDC054975]
MRDHDIPERADSGLSTEDIANPSPPGDEADDRQASEPPPVYPGESTGTPGLGADRDAGTLEERSGEEYERTPADESGQGYESTQEDESAEPSVRAQGYEGNEPSREGTGEDAESGGADADETPQLLSNEDEESFRSRWHDIQSLFVDDPREAVHAADGLVADVMQTLAATFADHKSRLEGQWSEGEDVDTESLRVALRQYRSFFNRLLNR